MVNKLSVKIWIINLQVPLAQADPWGNSPGWKISNVSDQWVSDDWTWTAFYSHKELRVYICGLYVDGQTISLSISSIWIV